MGCKGSHKAGEPCGGGAGEQGGSEFKTGFKSDVSCLEEHNGGNSWFVSDSYFLDGTESERV